MPTGLVSYAPRVRLVRRSRRDRQEVHPEGQDRIGNGLPVDVRGGDVERQLVHCLGVHLGPEELPNRIRCLGIELHLDRPCRVLGIEGRAIVELDALSQREPPRELVDLFVRSGQLGNQLVGARITIEQGLVRVPDDRMAIVRIAVPARQVAWPLGQRERQRGALDRCIARR